MKIAAIELIELQNIPVTPPVFNKPMRTGVRVVKVKTDNGLVGLSQLGGFMHSAGAAFLREELAPWVTLTERAGLGVEPNEDRVKEFQVNKSTQVKNYLRRNNDQPKSNRTICHRLFSVPTRIAVARRGPRAVLQG